MHRFLIVVFLFLAYTNAEIIESESNSTIAAIESNNNTINVKPETKTEKNLSENVTEIYQKYLSKITNYCLTKQEYEEMYGNKSSYGLLVLFAPLLINEASKQIGLNELRKYFHLKPQQFDFYASIEEIPENGIALSEDFNKSINYFQEERKRFGKPLYIGQFRPDDIDVAEEFLDRKIPEIRKMFKLRFQEAAGKLHLNLLKNIFNKTIIVKMFQILNNIRRNIFYAALTMNEQSYEGLLFEKSSWNICKKF